MRFYCTRYCAVDAEHQATAPILLAHPRSTADVQHSLVAWKRKHEPAARHSQANPQPIRERAVPAWSSRLLPLAPGLLRGRLVGQTEHRAAAGPAGCMFFPGRIANSTPCSRCQWSAGFRCSNRDPQETRSVCPDSRIGGVQKPPQPGTLSHSHALWLPRWPHCGGRR